MKTESLYAVYDPELRDVCLSTVTKDPIASWTEFFGMETDFGATGERRTDFTRRMRKAGYVVVKFSREVK